MTKKEKHESHFIPSPFPVVTSYEDAFIKRFNDNLAGAVAEVLKYIAHATASAVKETKKAEENDIEKAHKVGDIHKNGKWVWTEFQPGKFDWRTIKKKSKTLNKIELWKSRAEFSKCKTPKQCVDILVEKQIVTSNSSLDRCNLYTAQRVCSVLLNASEHFGMRKITIEVRKLSGAAAQAAGGKILTLDADLFKDFDSDRYFRSCVTDWKKSQESNYKRLKEKKEQLKKSGQWDAKRGKDLNEKIRLAKEAADKYRGWTVEYKGTACEDVVIHELGHILNAQCTGGCGMLRTWEDELRIIKSSAPKSGVKSWHAAYCDELQGRIKVAKELNQEHYNLWADYCKGTNLISKYGATKRVEGFAEMFVAYVHGDTELPQRVHDYYDKYFKEAKPK